MMEPKRGLPQAGMEQEAELNEALANFRTSVHAWVEAEYSKPRQAGKAVHLLSWRVATGWALGCVLATGTVSGGLFAHHSRQMRAKAAAVEAARQQALADEQRAAIQDEDFMVKVNSDVARQIPSAMEPLAQLMDEDEVQ